MFLLKALGYAAAFLFFVFVWVTWVTPSIRMVHSDELKNDEFVSSHFLIIGIKEPSALLTANNICLIKYLNNESEKNTLSNYKFSLPTGFKSLILEENQKIPSGCESYEQLTINVSEAENSQKRISLRNMSGTFTFMSEYLVSGETITPKSFTYFQLGDCVVAVFFAVLLIWLFKFIIFKLINRLKPRNTRDTSLRSF